MAYSLLNKTALVIGGSRGIGRMRSLRMGQAGATIVINYAHDQQAAEAVGKLHRAGKRNVVTSTFILTALYHSCSTRP